MQQANHYIIHTSQYDLGSKRLGGPMVEIYERGQIVIPKYIRDMLKLTPGTNLNVTVEGEKIVLERYDPIEELDKFRAEHAVYTTKELDRLMKKLDKKRHDELMKDVY